MDVQTGVDLIMNERCTRVRRLLLRPTVLDQSAILAKEFIVKSNSDRKQRDREHFLPPYLLDGEGKYIL